MFGFIKKLFRGRSSTPEVPPSKGLYRTGYIKAPPKRPPNAAEKPATPDLTPDFNEDDLDFHGKIEDSGPGKNVLIRNRYVREDTGTHESLKIVDDSLIDSGEPEGLDPYNSGQFDRSKKWDQRFRK